MPSPNASCDGISLPEKGSIETLNNCFSSDTKKVTGEKVHCSIPTKDISCSVTKNVDIDAYTRNLVRMQIRTKIYTQPAVPNTRMTHKKCAEDFGIDVTSQLKKSSKTLKINKKYFAEKNMKIDDIDIDVLEQPIRSSTPTPSIGSSTILAGNIDVSLNDVEETLDDDEITDLEKDDLFRLYIVASKRNSLRRKEHVVPDPSATTTGSLSKTTYCSDWMKKNDGVSTNNIDAPPSLYEPSVTLSDTLLNLTSISCNASPAVPKTGKDLNAATASLNKHKDTVFM